VKPILFAAACTLVLCTIFGAADESSSLPKAFIDGAGPDWTALGANDFVNVNCDPDTWAWKDGVAYCTGTPVGVARTQKQYTNFELVAQWRHMKPAGNSGVFVWADEAGLKDLKRGALPSIGIECQVLDHGFKSRWLENNPGKKADWFTTDGDVFAVGKSKMKPFPPTSPNGSRSFPRKNLSKAAGEWNHYYVRCVNGEVRLWVNGEEVSGGNQCEPRSGYVCLESEGSPVEFKNLRIRELP
jgi:hypothetical protein